MTDLGTSFCFVAALVGGLSAFFALACLVTDVLWPRLAMRHRRQATYLRGRART